MSWADPGLWSGIRGAHLATLAALILGACESPPQNTDVVPSPNTDRAPARRIITLAPHLTELVYAAGAGDSLVGVVAFSDFPPAAARLPRIGDAFRVDYEAVVGLQPDLVLGWGSGTPAASLNRLRQLGVRVVTLEAAVLEDIGDQLLMIGSLAGSERAARAAADAYGNRLQRLRRRQSETRRLRVFYQLSERPLSTVTSKHVIGQAIELCGGVNIFAGLADAVPAVSIEAVLDAAPELILASKYGAGDPSATLASWQDWPNVPAVRLGNLFMVDADLISRPSVRILDGVTELCDTMDRARLARLPIHAGDRG
jgi:iron complex transport system substrate-binding protein